MVSSEKKNQYGLNSIVGPTKYLTVFWNVFYGNPWKNWLKFKSIYHGACLTNKYCFFFSFLYFFSFDEKDALAGHSFEVASGTQAIRKEKLQFATFKCKHSILSKWNKWNNWLNRFVLHILFAHPFLLMALLVLKSSSQFQKKITILPNIRKSIEN